MARRDNSQQQISAEATSSANNADNSKARSNGSCDHRITLRFKASEWAIIEADIEATGLTANAYFRQLALENPVPRKARQRVGDGSMKVVGRFVGQLGKLGSNMNQLAKQSNKAAKQGEWAAMPTAKLIEEKIAAAVHLLESVRTELLTAKREHTSEN